MLKNVVQTDRQTDRQKGQDENKYNAAQENCDLHVG